MKPLLKQTRNSVARAKADQWRERVRAGFDPITMKPLDLARLTPSERRRVRQFCSTDRIAFPSSDAAH